MPLYFPLQRKRDFLGYAWQWLWVAKKMVDFAVAEKKSPIHISICAELTIVGTTAIF